MSLDYSGDSGEYGDEELFASSDLQHEFGNRGSALPNYLDHNTLEYSESLSPSYPLSTAAFSTYTPSPSLSPSPYTQQATLGSGPSGSQHARRPSQPMGSALRGSRARPLHQRSSSAGTGYGTYSHQEVQLLRQSNNDLLLRVARLEGELKATNANFTTLSRSVVQGPITTTTAQPVQSSGNANRIVPLPQIAPLPCFIESDYSLLLWRQSSWNPKNAPASQGRGFVPWFEDENGDPLPVEKCNRVRAAILEAFNRLKEAGYKSKTFSKYPPTVKAYVYAAAYAAEPDTALCEDNWKVRKLAEEMHTSWHNTNYPDEHDTKATKAKRARAEEEQRQRQTVEVNRKRQKTEPTDKFTSDTEPVAEVIPAATPMDLDSPVPAPPRRPRVFQSVFVTKTAPSSSPTPSSTLPQHPAIVNTPSMVPYPAMPPCTLPSAPCGDFPMAPLEDSGLVASADSNVPVLSDTSPSAVPEKSTTPTDSPPSPPSLDPSELGPGAPPTDPAPAQPCTSPMEMDFLTQTNPSLSESLPTAPNETAPDKMVPNETVPTETAPNKTVPTEMAPNEQATSTAPAELSAPPNKSENPIVTSIAPENPVQSNILPTASVAAPALTKSAGRPPPDAPSFAMPPGTGVGSATTTSSKSVPSSKGRPAVKKLHQRSSASTAKGNFSRKWYDEHDGLGLDADFTKAWDIERKKVQ